MWLTHFFRLSQDEFEFINKSLRFHFETSKAKVLRQELLTKNLTTESQKTPNQKKSQLSFENRDNLK